MQWWDTNFWWSSNMAEWVGGIGTVLALVFAGRQVQNGVKDSRSARAQSEKVLEQNRISIQQTERSLAMQAERDGLDRIERRRAQAASVSCSTMWSTSLASIVFHCRNDSGAAIFDVRLFTNTTARMWSWSEAQAATLIPGQELQEVVACQANRVPPPGQFAGFTFRDNEGEDWIKWGDGRLVPGTHRDVTDISPCDVVLNDFDPRDPQ